MSEAKPAVPGPQGAFNLDEVLHLKGHHFKIVLIDGYTGKIALKWITPEEAAILEAGAPKGMGGVITGGDKTRRN